MNLADAYETMLKGEFTSVALANGGLENMINWDGKDKDTLGYQPDLWKGWN